MAQIRESVDIRAPIDRVFAALTDPRRGPDWNPNLIDVRDIAPEPLGPGTVWKQTAMVAGRPMDLICRVTRLDPPRYGVLEITGAQEARVTTECSEADGVTHVTQTLEYRPPRGMFGRLAGSFVSNALRREIVRSMDRQRTILEAEHRAGSGPRAS